MFGVSGLCRRTSSGHPDHSNYNLVPSVQQQYVPLARYERSKGHRYWEQCSLRTGLLASRTERSDRTRTERSKTRASRTEQNCSALVCNRLLNLSAWRIPGCQHRSARVHVREQAPSFPSSKALQNTLRQILAEAAEHCQDHHLSFGICLVDLELLISEPGGKNIREATYPAYSCMILLLSLNQTSSGKVHHLLMLSILQPNVQYSTSDGTGILVYMLHPLMISYAC